MSKSPVITRKDIKEPDQFQTAANSAAVWLAKRKRQVVLVAGAAVAVVVLLLVVATIQAGREQSAGVTADALFRTMEAIISPTAIPGTVTFPTEEARQKAILEAAGKVLAEHGGTRPAEMALLAQADAHYQLRAYDEAKAGYEKFLATAGPDDSLRFGALEGLGLVAEAKGDVDGALAAYDRLAKEQPGFAARAELDKAGVLARAGKAAEAKEILSRFGEKHAGSPLAGEAAQRLAALGGQ